MMSDSLLPKKWVVYSTYSASGEPAAYVLEQLRQYRSLGFKILIVDTSPFISPAREQGWVTLADDWFSRLNIGYDFASYREGLRHLKVEHGESVDALHLILANDSCFGPFFPLQRVLERFDSVPQDAKTVLGLTDSHEVRYHLQSYWIYFRPDVCRFASEFLSEMQVAKSRDDAIEVGEIAFSRYLLTQGCNLQAYCSVVDTVRSSSRSLIPYWGILDFSVRRYIKKYKYSRRGDGACLKYLLRRPNPFSFLNQTHDFALVIFARKLSPLIKRSFFRSEQFGDRSVLATLDVESLSNAEASKILHNKASTLGGY